MDSQTKGFSAKCLGYALGEIILIVLGIIIALNIDNWNQNRKGDHLKRELLVSLRSDLELDRNLMGQIPLYDSLRLLWTQMVLDTMQENSISDKLEEITNAGSRLNLDLFDFPVQFMAGSKTGRDELVLRAFRAVISPRSSYPQDATYKALTQSNVFATMKDLTLHNLISNYYARLNYLNML